MVVESNHEGRFLRDFVKLSKRDITVCKELVMQAQRSECKVYNAYKNCLVCSVAHTYNSCMGMQKQDFCGEYLAAILM